VDNTHDTDWFVKQSLIYERACSRISNIINTILGEKNRDAEMSKETGEAVDESYQVLADALIKVRNEFRARSDELWKQAEDSTDRYDSGYENLFNAVVIKAAQDYEEALCGLENERSKQILEMFLPKRFVDPIRRAKPKFSKIVKERGEDILKETREVRKRDGDLRENSIKCPLCGCGLYAWGSNQGGLQKIKCTGCSLFDFAYIKEDEDES